MKQNLLLYGEFGWEISSSVVVPFLLDAQQNGDSVDVHINSVGGDVFEAIAIYNELRKTDATIYVDSLAASAAAIVALCGKKLIVGDYARLMLHSASSFAQGNKKDMEEQMRSLDAIDHDLANMIAGKMGKDGEEIYNTYFDGNDHFLTADECVSMGIAEKMQATQDKSRLSIVFDCINGTRKTNQHPINKNMKLEDFKNIGALAGVTDEASLISKVSDVCAQNSVKDAKIAELQKIADEYAELCKEMKAKQDADDMKVITDAIAEGKITADQKDAYTALMKADRENCTAIINAMAAPKQKSVNDYLNQGENNGVPMDAWQKRLAKINGVKLKNA